MAGRNRLQLNNQASCSSEVAALLPPPFHHQPPAAQHNHSLRPTARQGQDSLHGRNDFYILIRQPFVPRRLFLRSRTFQTPICNTIKRAGGTIHDSHFCPSWEMVKGKIDLEEPGA